MSRKHWNISTIEYVWQNVWQKPPDANLLHKTEILNKYFEEITWKNVCHSVLYIRCDNLWDKVVGNKVFHLLYHKSLIWQSLSYNIFQVFMIWCQLFVIGKQTKNNIWFVYFHKAFKETGNHIRNMYWFMVNKMSLNNEAMKSILLYSFELILWHFL